MLRQNAPLDALTSLRFFAALAVVFYHSGAGFAQAGHAPRFVDNLLNNGWLGVPFFFILSGFILSYAHSDIHFDRTELRQFAVARFSRLYPVYLLALLLSAPFVEHFQASQDWQQFLLLQSWAPGSGAADWNFVAWTLSVECFFYLIFPSAFIFVRNLSDRGLLIGLAMTAAVLVVVWLNMTPQLGNGRLELAGRSWLFPRPLLRVPEFVYGVFLGVVFLRGVFTPPAVTASVALGVIAVAAAVSTSNSSQTLALLTFGPLIFSLAAGGKSGRLHALLDHRLLVLLGGSSYALYLLQYPLRRLIGVCVPDRWQLFGRLAFAPLLIFVSVCIFLYFEAPARRFLRAALSPGRSVPAAKPEPSPRG